MEDQERLARLTRLRAVQKSLGDGELTMDGVKRVLDVLLQEIIADRSVSTETLRDIIPDAPARSQQH